jgi:sugar/nucleoside kinase (ribokinase family)
MKNDFTSIGAGNSFLGGFAAGLMLKQGDVVEGMTVAT